jgi:hypothetical protein
VRFQTPCVTLLPSTGADGCPFPSRLPLSENSADSLKGRILELSLADLNKDEEQAFRKIKLRVDEVSGKSCLTNFHGVRPLPHSSPPMSHS